MSTVYDLAVTENKFFLEAEKNYGKYASHAMESHTLIQDFISGLMPNGWVFMISFSQVRTHHLLALFSTVRKHHVQTIMNLRQVLESGANAAYSIASPNPDDFVVPDENGILTLPLELKKKRYDWLKQNFPKGSDSIKSMKDSLQVSTHANLIDAYRNFKFEVNGSKGIIETPFFDLPHETQVQTDLWTLGNVSMGLLDLFYGINLKYPTFIPCDDFVNRIQKLEAVNLSLKEELMNTKSMKRANQIASKKLPCENV